MEKQTKRLLITGGSGYLGSYLLREVRDRANVTAWSGTRAVERFGIPCRPVDLGDHDAVASAFRAVRPDVVLHPAALARVAECHANPDQAQRINTGGTVALAELAAAAGARLVFVSTDLVFDGEHPPYREGDPTTPVSVYGRTKAAAEQAVRATPRGLVVRLSLLCGPSLSGQPSFFDQQIEALRTARPVTLFADEWRTPVHLATAAAALLALASSDVTGILHVGGPERLSRLEMGRRMAAWLGVSGETIVACRRQDVPSAESRPRDVSLDSSRWRGLFPTLPWPGFDESLRCFR
jgi:dTDP-4-dehydrorhamnose reductase